MEKIRGAWKAGGRRTRAIIVITGAIMACCCGIFGISAADTSMRAVGILPTLTMTPTETLIPTETSIPSTTEAQSPTVAPPATATPLPTMTPSPTETPQLYQDGPRVVINRVNKRNEYVDLANEGNQTQDLTGWVLLSQKGAQSCELQGEIAPGQTLRVWAMTEDAGEEGFCCHFDSPIWNNDEIDLAILLDAQGQEVDRK